MAKLTDSYNLKKINPKLAKEWHPTKNGNLTPKDVTPNSAKNVWWICDNYHEWLAKIDNRANGTGCPFCAGQSVCQDNCLQTRNPKLSNEWHPAKNGNLTSKDITAGSSKKVWWRCQKGHEWQAIVRCRVKGAGCPFCIGLYASEEKNLRVINPKLAKELHPVKNGNLSPKDVLPKSNKKVWWRCTNGHDWQASVVSRSRGKGCPYCAGKLVSKDRNLKVLNPKLAEEWHTTKNGDLTPKDILPGSNKKRWWQCKKGHEWKAYVFARNKGINAIQTRIKLDRPGAEEWAETGESVPDEERGNGVGSRDAAKTRKRLDQEDRHGLFG